MFFEGLHLMCQGNFLSGEKLDERHMKMISGNTAVDDEGELLKMTIKEGKSMN